MSNVSDTPASIGVQSFPVSGFVVLEDNNVNYPLYSLTFKLVNARVPITDAGASGSFGTLKLFTFVAGAVHVEAAFQNYISFVEGSALTTGAGNAAFKIGVGSVAIAAAADAALVTTSVDMGAAVTLTNVGGTSAGKLVTTSAASFDGTVTPVTVNLNISVSAATSNANSYMDVTGFFTVEGRFIS